MLKMYISKKIVSKGYNKIIKHFNQEIKTKFKIIASTK